MSSALLHPLVAACLALAPAAPASEPVPAAEPTADADAPAADADAPDDAAPDDAAPEPSAAPDDAAPSDAAPDDAAPDDAAPEPSAADGAPAADETAAATEASGAPAPRERPETVSAPPPRATVVGPPSDGRRDDVVSKALLGGGLGSLGLGLGLAGVSAWFWVERSQADRNIELLEPGAARTEAEDQRKQFGTLATVTAVAGSVYAVTGVALLLLHARDRKRVSATPTVGAVNGVVVQGRF